MGVEVAEKNLQEFLHRLAAFDVVANDAYLVERLVSDRISDDGWPILDHWRPKLAAMAKQGRVRGMLFMRAPLLFRHCRIERRVSCIKQLMVSEFGFSEADADDFAANVTPTSGKVIV